jgi:Transcriptional regulator
MANPSRQHRKRMQSTNDLKAALIDLLLEGNDADSITVSEIAGRADYNRSTFYFHYKDKNELLEELFRDAIGGFRNAVESTFRHVRSINLDEVAPTTRLSFEHVERNKKLFKALHSIRRSDSLYERLEQMYFELFRGRYHFYRKDPSLAIDDEMTMSYQIHAMIGTVKYWIQSDFKYSADYMCEQITRVHAHRPTDIVAQSQG